MSLDREKIWQAYLDGELTVGETAEFETTLGAEERERLAGEKQFEAGLAEVLSNSADCPDEAWQRIQAQVRAARPPQKAAPLRRWNWAAGTVVAAAAAVAFFIAFAAPSFLDSPHDASRSATVVSAATVDELAALSETAPDLKAVREYLERRGIDLFLIGADDWGISAFHFDIDILGARVEHIDGREVVSLLFGCCDRPVKVVIARRGSEEARMLGETVGEASSQVQCIRAIGGNDQFLVAVVGRHRTASLLDLFRGQPVEAAPAH